MTDKKSWSIFDPLPGSDSFPDLGTGFDKDVISGKTSKEVHKEVFGDISDRGLFNDIFGAPRKPASKKYVDETLESKRLHRPLKNKRDF